ncbi:MAG TPA: hypothetical protein VFT39_18900 [Vicinamibacterales bacterium]|nr:hypothetical protein [Vicinamibacterales bacterium]
MPLAAGKGNGKNQIARRERGHGSYRAGVDTSIAVEAKGTGTGASKLSVIEVSCEKQKDEEEPRMHVGTERVVLKEASETKSGRQMSTLVVVECELDKLVKELTTFSETAQNLLSTFERLAPEHAGVLTWKDWTEAYLKVYPAKSESALTKARKELSDANEVEQVKGQKGCWQLGPGTPEDPDSLFEPNPEGGMRFRQRPQLVVVNHQQKESA